MSIDNLIERLRKPHRQMHRSGRVVEKSSPAIQHEAANSLASTQAEILRLRALLDSIIARDDRNGSLPEWYRHEIDANYERPAPPPIDGED